VFAVIPGRKDEDQKIIIDIKSVPTDRLVYEMIDYLFFNEGLRF